MTSSAIKFDFSSHCPHLSCGEAVRADSSRCTRACEKCGSDLVICSSCGATNRPMAVYCRGCKQRNRFEVCPVQRGLQAVGASFSSIQMIDQIQAPFPKRFAGTMPASPLAVDGLLVLAFSDGRVQLISENSGSTVGQIASCDKIAVTPALKDGFLYVAAGSQLEAFDLTRSLYHLAIPSLKPAWTAQTIGGTIITPLLVDDKSVYMVTREGEQILLEAVSRSDGSRAWAEPLRLGASRIVPPALIKDVLMLVTLDGEANVIEPVSGAVNETLDLQSMIDPEVFPYVVGDRMLLADRSGDLLEISFGRNGFICNHIFGQRGRISSIAASESYIVVGHMAGLTLLNSRGHALWSNNSLEPVSVSPIVSGESIFAIDNSGLGLLFDVLRSNPVERVKMLSREVSLPPLMTHSNIVAASAGGELSLIVWR
jgi:hypothetical protein